MNYLSIDVETANADYSSICQIGIVEVQNGDITDKWSTLVNPEAYFDPFNISIHSITESDVENAPTFDSLYSELKNRITGQITVHHMPFDKIAINRACSVNDLDFLNANWLDSAKIVRRTWEDFAYRGYGLANIAKHLEIEFEHHDALEDAKVAALIVRHACEKTGLSIHDWLDQIHNPISGSINSSLVENQYEGLSKGIDGNPDGPLFGESIVFTGSLYLSRNKAAEIASNLGCDVKTSVSKKTTILVVGTQDLTKLSGYKKSTKHRKAENLIENGIPIKIFSESDFVEMCNNENPDLNLAVPNSRNINEEVKKKKSVSFEIRIQENN
jgi:DNA polymerase III subunit epsilon